MAGGEDSETTSSPLFLGWHRHSLRFFLAFSLLIPHRAGIVTSVGKISRYTAHSGTGIHRSGHIRYASDVKVRVKDTNKIETVYYRVANPLKIPSTGDEVVFASYPLTGNGPYPQMWAVWLGAIMLVADVVVAAGYLIPRYRRKNASEGA